MSRIDYDAWDKYLQDQSSDEEEKKKKSASVRKYKIDWSQTRTTVTITIQLQPHEGQKGNIEVNFKPQALFVTCKTALKPIINGPTSELIRPEHCQWWLDGDKLHVELDKAMEGVQWTEVIGVGIKSNVIDQDKIDRDKRNAEIMEKRKREDEERARMGKGSYAAELVEKMGPASYPPREKHRPYRDDPADLFLFEVD